MMSATMALQDDNGSVDSGSMRNQVPMDVDVSSTKSIHLKEKLHSVDDLAFKVRKPYTITKQRERWTEEEHKKFLEALKLYGRAWRRIEEHVGTKTAVQIRSHAQKFFTKVVRESNTGEADSVKSIEIPPPRPKRKPLHPYPRKVSASAKATDLLIEKPMHSGAAEENQSPTSVLSAYYSSDAPGATDSNTPEGSLSPISSVVCGSAGLVCSEQPNLSSANGDASQSSSQMNNSSNQDEKSPVKLELFPEEDSFLKEGSVEVSSTQCLKLFGKTLMVTDSCRPSSLTSGACKVQVSSEIDGKKTQPLGPLQWNCIPISYPQVDLECSWGALTFGAQATIYCLPRQNEMCSYEKVESAPIVRAIPIKASLPSDCKEVEKTEALKDGSSSNSSAESQCVDGDSNLEAQSCQLILGNKERASLSNKHGHRTCFWKHRASSQKRTQGFLPYKRCIADRDARAVALGKEREEQQRTRLCL